MASVFCLRDAAAAAAAAVMVYFLVFDVLLERLESSLRDERGCRC